MSRIGSKAVAIPEGVDVTLDGTTVRVKGKLGEQTLGLVKGINIAVDKEEGVTVTPADKKKKTLGMWATTRSLINNMITGVSEGFKKELELRGVGYRAQMQGNKLKLQLGLSHDVLVDTPEGLKIEAPSQTEVIITGSDKQRVGQLAANIRDLRPPEPYKGKGIRYKDEYVLIKEGKTK